MRALATRKTAATAAFTLVEMVIASTLLAFIFAAIGMTVLTGKQQFRQGMTMAALEARGRRTLDRIANELQGAGGATLVPDPVGPLGSSSLQYRVCTGYTGAAMSWGPLMQIQRLADPRDAADGIDNDSDGLVDEGRVVLTRDVGGANQRQVTLANGVSRFLQGEVANAADDNANGLVDEGGLSFVVDANRTLTIRLSLEARDPRGRRLIRTVTTAVHMRN